VFWKAGVRVTFTSLIAATILISPASLTSVVSLGLRYFDIRNWRCATVPKTSWCGSIFGSVSITPRNKKYYARGLDGSFVCRDEARRSGYRRSLLGLR
jgi:hypothetical protein